MWLSVASSCAVDRDAGIRRASDLRARLLLARADHPIVGVRIELRRIERMSPRHESGAVVDRSRRLSLERDCTTDAARAFGAQSANPSSKIRRRRAPLQARASPAQRPPSLPGDPVAERCTVDRLGVGRLSVGDARDHRRRRTSSVGACGGAVASERILARQPDRSARARGRMPADEGRRTLSRIRRRSRRGRTSTAVGSVCGARLARRGGLGSERLGAGVGVGGFCWVRRRRRRARCNCNDERGYVETHRQPVSKQRAAPNAPLRPGEVRARDDVVVVALAHLSGD